MNGSRPVRGIKVGVAQHPIGAPGPVEQPRPANALAKGEPMPGPQSISPVTAACLALYFLLGCSFDTHPLWIAADTGPNGDRARVDGPQPTSAGDPASVATPAAGNTDSKQPDARIASDALPSAESGAATPSNAFPASDAGVGPNAVGLGDGASPSAPIDASPTAPAASPTTGSCAAGRYLGDFICSWDPTGLTPLNVMTQVSFELQPRRQRLTLSVENARLSFDIAGFVFEGDLAGDLDCASGTLHADIVNGMFTSVLLPVSTPFEGTVDGELDRNTRGLVGSWSFSATGSTCVGTWRAMPQR